MHGVLEIIVRPSAGVLQVRPCPPWPPIARRRHEPGAVVRIAARKAPSDRRWRCPPVALTHGGLGVASPSRVTRSGAVSCRSISVVMAVRKRLPRSRSSARPCRTHTRRAEPGHLRPATRLGGVALRVTTRLERHRPRFAAGLAGCREPGAPRRLGAPARRPVRQIRAWTPSPSLPARPARARCRTFPGPARRVARDRRWWRGSPLRSAPPSGP